MSYDAQKKFFETAYKTGTDLWTDKLYVSKVFEYLGKLPAGAMTLDLGTGRGRWAITMAEAGFKVIGVDYVTHLISTNNREAKAKGLEGKIRFIEGDVFDIPLADNTIDVVTDFGLLQHIHREDWPKYGSEVRRVLRPGGHVLVVALSKETPKFFDFSPKDVADASIEKYGASYHFFTPEEIMSVFGHGYTLIQNEVLFSPKESEALLFALLRKD